MRTRNSNFPNNSNVTIPRRRNKGRAPYIVEPELRTIVTPMAEHAMEELLRAPTKGYGEAIVLPKINADHFEIKTNLLQLVQANTFYSLENENPHAHINSFKRITSTLRFRNMPNDVIKLMMFPYSLEGAAKTWYEKEPPNSILTWEDLVTKFVNQFFPPSKTTHLKNKISRFTQKFDESFSEAWERFKDMLRACPHHGFTELTQVYTFYNGLNDNDQDSLNAAAGGNLLSKTTREALNIIENKSKVRYLRNKPNNRSNVSRMNATSSKTDERIDKLADQLSTLVEIVSKKVVTPAPVKAVEETYVTCGGAHSWYNCLNTDNNQASVCATTGTYNQVNPLNRVSNQMAPPGFALVQNNGQNSYKRNNDQMMRNMQNQINSLKGDLKNEIQNTIKSQQAVMMNQQTTFQNNLENMICGLFQNQASTSGTLSSNTIPNPKGEMKAITTQSGVAYEGPSIPTNLSPKKVVERETEETTDKEQSKFQGSTAQIPLPVDPIPILELDVLKSLPKPNIPYLSRCDDQKSRDKALNQKEKIFQMFQDLRFDVSFADALLLMPKFAPTIKSLLMNKEKLLELAKIPVNRIARRCSSKSFPKSLEIPASFLYHDSFKKFTDEPALVCLPLSEDDNDEKEKHEVKNLVEPTPKRQTRITPRLKNFKGICKEIIFHSNKTPQVSSVFAITSTLPPIEPKDSLIMGDEHLSTFSAEEIIPIPRESEDTSRSDSKNVLPSCNDFSSINVPCDDSVTLSNPLFEFDVNFNSSDINLLFDKVLEDIECKDSYDSNLDESTFLVMPLSNSNKDEILYDAPIDKANCFDPGGDNDEIDVFLAIEVPMYIEEGYYDSEGDVIYLESLLCDDTTHNLSPEVFFDHKPQHDTFSPKSDPLHHVFTGELIMIPPGIVREHEDYINRMSLLCGNSSSRSPENSHIIIESLPTSTTLIKDSDSNREEIDIFFGPDDSIPPGIESDFDSEEDIIDNLLNDDPISEYERLTFDMEPDVLVISNVNEDECFNPGGGEINVEVDDFFTFVTWTFLPYLTYPKVSPLLSSTENEDTIFNPGIST
ncbi:reverse transcriptase domain-containing protein [Tanacetum coccineum]